ncbi:MAG: type II secretion system protein [Planctomycetes bacterium]|nr:type II secretion system protein [Planctomycetota bacterium]
MTPPNETRHEATSGFSLLELMIAVAFLATCFLGVGYAMQAGIRSTREMRERQVIQARAQIYLDRLTFLNFGAWADPTPSASQLDAVFSPEGSVTAVTLASLTHSPSDEGWTFETTDFPVQGRWAVIVTRDVDGDGTVSGEIEENWLAVRIEISFDGWPVLSTVRGRETHA